MWRFWPSGYAYEKKNENFSIKVDFFCVKSNNKKELSVQFQRRFLENLPHTNYFFVNFLNQYLKNFGKNFGKKDNSLLIQVFTRLNLEDIYYYGPRSWTTIFFE